MVIPAGDFTISVAPQFVQPTLGNYSSYSASYVVTVTGVNGFSGAVTLSPVTLSVPIMPIGTQSVPACFNQTTCSSKFSLTVPANGTASTTLSLAPSGLTAAGAGEAALANDRVGGALPVLSVYLQF